MRRTNRRGSAPRPVVPPPAGKTLLSSSNFTYLGAFKIDSSHSSEKPVGFAVRRVAGQKRIMFLDFSSVGLGIVEYTVPALVSSSADWPTGAGLNPAVFVKRWGNSFTTAAIAAINAGSGYLWGLSWDEADKRAYWTIASVYSNVTDPNPSFGWVVLDDDANTATPGAMVALSGVPQKQIQGGVLPIPQTFADTYLSGKRLGVGFGGYRSLLAQGSAGSIGPALYAINPPSGASADNATVSGGPCLMRSEIAERRHPRPSWAGLCSNNFEGGGDPAKWGWNNQHQNAMAWIDTPTLEGILLYSSFAGGRMTATIASGTSNSVTVTNAADIVDVSPGDLVMVDTGPGGNGFQGEMTVDHVSGATITFTASLPDTATVSGACYGGEFYANSVIHYSRWQASGILIYRPSDLAEVALGSRQPYDVVPADSFRLDPPDLTLPYPYPAQYAAGLSSMTAGGPHTPALCYDPVESRLYACWLTRHYLSGTLGAYPLVFVYGVG